MTSDALIDLLLDLKHDLGKHLQLPLALLPKGADARAFQHTAWEALTRTRRSPCGDCSARRLWHRFVTEAGDALVGCRGFAALEQAVERALAWEQRIATCSAMDCDRGLRREIEGDFGKVTECIAHLIDEVSATDDARG